MANGRGEAEQEATAEEADRPLHAYMAQVEASAIKHERVRIARELHDGLGQHLHNINMHIGVAHRTFESDRALAQDSLGIAKTEISKAQRELRYAIDALVSEEYLAGALEDLLAGPIRDCTLAGIVVEFQIAGIPRPLPVPVKHGLYRIGQEALTNMRQHARATWTLLRVEYEARQIRMVVADNGVGMPRVDRHRGHGLDNLQERAALIGGTSMIETCPGHGVRIIVEVPT